MQFLSHSSPCIFIPVKSGPLDSQEFSFTRPQGPFFYLLTETGIASMFLKAVAADTEQAKVFLSKNCAIDLEALREAIEDTHSSLIPQKNVSDGKKIILLGNQNYILRFYMVKEPDRYGQWKVYGVEKE